MRRIISVRRGTSAADRIQEGFSTLAEIRAFPTTDVLDKTCALLEGVGLFAYDSTGVGVDDGTTTLEPDSGIGRWFSVLGGSPPPPVALQQLEDQWFVDLYNAPDPAVRRYATIQAALDAWTGGGLLELLLSGGTHDWDGTGSAMGDASETIKFRGSGRDATIVQIPHNTNIEPLGGVPFLMQDMTLEITAAALGTLIFALGDFKFDNCRLNGILAKLKDGAKLDFNNCDCDSVTFQTFSAPHVLQVTGRRTLFRKDAADSDLFFFSHANFLLQFSACQFIGTWSTPGELFSAFASVGSPTLLLEDCTYSLDGGGNNMSLFNLNNENVSAHDTRWVLKDTGGATYDFGEGTAAVFVAPVGALVYGTPSLMLNPPVGVFYQENFVRTDAAPTEIVAPATVFTAGTIIWSSTLDVRDHKEVSVWFDPTVLGSNTQVDLYCQWSPDGVFTDTDGRQQTDFLLLTGTDGTFKSKDYVARLTTATSELVAGEEKLITFPKKGRYFRFGVKGNNASGAFGARAQRLA
jgi:hypothetical protein